MPRLIRSEEDQKLADSHGPDFLEILARGLKVIAAFSADKRRLTLSDLAAAVALPRATARRILHTLESLGYVQSDGRLFSLTPKVLEFASAYLASSTIPGVMQPIVERISAAIHENCSAAVLHDVDAVFVARATPLRIMTVGLEIGYRLPAYCSAVGRVLLAGLSDDEIDARLERMSLIKVTEKTMTAKKALRAAIRLTRAQGYSLVDEEAEHGLRSLAVPVRRYNGDVVCAIHIGVHVERVGIDTMLTRFKPLIVAAADEAQKMLL